jgi:hypothetical protein
MNVGSGPARTMPCLSQPDPEGQPACKYLIGHGFLVRREGSRSPVKNVLIVLASLFLHC